MRGVSLLFVTTIVSVFAGCGGTDSPSAPSPRVRALTINGTAPAVGASAQFTATAALADGSSLPVTNEATWQSSNPVVATVERGVVRGLAVGEADITARYENTTGKQHIAVALAACTYSVSPTTVSIPPVGGTATVSVFASPTQANCGWTAESSESFVTITSGTSGTGNGTVSISVPANPDAARSAVLTIAGRQVPVSQTAGNCVTSVSPASVEYSAEVKFGSVTVTAPADCRWTAVIVSPFITAAGGSLSGIGNGSFGYRVFGNLTGAPRAGSIQVLQQTVSVTQRAARGGNFLSFVSDPTDPIGQGWTFLLEAPTSAFTARVNGSNRRSVSFTVVGSDGVSTMSWTLDLSAPEGQQLVPGTYLNATRYPDQAPTVPGLAVSGDGRRCGVLSGQFTVTEADYAGDGSVQRFRVTFEQHCNGLGPALRGTLSYVR